MLKLKEDSSKREITHLDHLGIVAGVCDEIGLSSHIDRFSRTTKSEYGDIDKSDDIEWVRFCSTNLIFKS